MEPQKQPAYHAVVQSAHQSKAGRLVQHFKDDVTREKLFPTNFAEEAVEVGPHSNMDGPCLVLFKNMGISKAEALDWFENQVLVKRQAVRLYFIDHVLPGSTTREELVQHIAAQLDRDVVHRLYCWPRSSQVPLAYALDDNAVRVAQRDWSAALMVVQTSEFCGWSVVPPQLAYQHPQDVQKHFVDSVATAVNKVHEALLVSGLQLGSIGWALDLGAAPGGWTKYLSRHARHVVAVDPAALDPQVLEAPNVTHVRQQAAAAVGTIRGLMGGDLADLLVSDMNQYPKNASLIVADLLPLLRPGGLLIMTLKFPGVGRDRSPTVRHLDDFFKAELLPGRCCALLANTANESTYYAYKR